MPEMTIPAEPYAWPHDGILEAQTTALMIIDMQNDFCEPDGYLDLSGYDISVTRRVIPAVLAVRKAIRAWGGLIIYTREGHRPDLSDLTPLKAWRSQQSSIGIGATGPNGRLLVRGEHGCDIVGELTPASHEIIIDKPGYSCFYATDLQRILNARGIRNIIFTGITTDVCVHSTLRDAVDRGFECLVIEDACAASVPDNHAAAIRTIMTEGGIFGAVTTSAQLDSILSSGGPNG